MMSERTQTILHTVLKAIIILAVMFGGLMVLSNVFYPRNNQYEYGMIDSAANGALGERADTVDVLFVGDSEVHSNITPMEMWHELGITAYDCSTSKQQLPYDNTLMRRAAEKHKPNIIVIETNTIYSPFAINDVIFRSLQDAIPIFEYHSYWKRFVFTDVPRPPRTTWTDDMKGYRLNMDVKPADTKNYMKPTDDVFEIPQLNSAYLRTMIDYCRSIGATPVLVSAPSSFNWNMARHNGVEKWAQAEGVDYLDFNLPPYEPGIDWQAETRDEGDHLNYYGARKFSLALGNTLREKYGLEDHRGDSNYDTWNAAYERYHQRVAEQAEKRKQANQS